jgi:hypothetical protein
VSRRQTKIIAAREGVVCKIDAVIRQPFPEIQKRHREEYDYEKLVKK